MPAVARKILPLIRPLCPFHGVAMLVRRKRRGCREWYCWHKGCKHTTKNEAK